MAGPKPGVRFVLVGLKLSEVLQHDASKVLGRDFASC